MKKMRTKIMAVLLAVSLVPASVATTTAEAAAAPKLKDKKLTIQKGQTKKLKVIGKRIKSKSFSSTKKKIATVTKTGKVKGKKVGTCRIKVTVRYKKAKNKKALSAKTLTCQIKVTDADEKVTTTPKSTKQPKLSVSEDFQKQLMETSVTLMKKSAVDDLEKGENILISPESIMTAMAMVTNGAGSDTLSELQKALYGDLSVDDFNTNMSTYNDYLTSSAFVKFYLANAIWIRNEKDRIQANQSFLDTNERYYHAGAYLEPFDSTTLKKINDWVKTNTDGMIPSILENIPSEAQMYLTNALAFEGNWEWQYSDQQVEKDTFTSASGEEQTVSMLNSNEHAWIHDDKATGVIKYYEGSEFAFAAILPNKGVSVSDYLTGLTGESFAQLIQSEEYRKVKTKIPEFSYDYSADLKGVCQSMGIQKAFTADADFENMATTGSGSLYIDNILHKTHIELDQYGTRAAAVTVVAMTEAAATTEEPKEVYLDRPFLYAIIETDTGLPVFMGAVNSIE